MLTVAGLALAWVTDPERWDDFSGDVHANVPPDRRLTRGQVWDMANHLTEHLVSGSVVLLTAEAN